VINLIPPDVKQNIVYARHNSILRRWIGVFIASIVGVGIITVFGVFYMNQSVSSLTADNAKTKQDLEKQKINDVQKQVQDISNTLTLTVQVLSREILFSSLIKQITKAIPDGSILTGLEISQVQGGIDLNFVAKDYNTATQIQVNLQDPSNKIFDKSDIISITCSKTGGSTVAGYPCTVPIRALFSKNNPYLFINSGAKK
jgi:Tfp pilus assembly protein PilN